VDEQLIIREDWMRRVEEIVRDALAADMLVVLNSHHDNSLFRLTDEHMEFSQIALERIWTQIAYNFRDYNENLIFEGLNEPRTIGTRAEWNGGTPVERENLNILNQVFVDAVRATGGNNAERVLMIPTYAASSSRNAQHGFPLPSDTAPNRIIVSLHMYSPWEFALRTGEYGVRNEWHSDNPDDTNPITYPIDMAYHLFVRHGVPVMLDEMGVLNRDNLPYRVAWSEFYVSYAREHGIPCFWWDNGAHHVTAPNEWGGWDETFGILNRETNQIAHPQIVAALMRATE
jgi:endoglucanase